MKEYSVSLTKRTKSDVFLATNKAGHKVSINGLSAKNDDAGISPMEMMLAATGGCAGIDVISILKHEADDIEELKIGVLGYRNTEETPAYFRKVSITFTFKTEISSEKLHRSIELSLSKYCTVGKTLAAFAEIDWVLVKNGEELHSATVSQEAE